MNLDNFIYQDLDWNAHNCSLHPEYLFDQHPPIWWRTTECIDVMFQLANGLEFIHSHGHVHRDLKPHNSKPFLIYSWSWIVLYVAVSRRWKIGDFGITSEATGTMSTRQARGTDSYRAPELLGLLGEMRYSQKSDIWSVGVILYELFMRRKAFAGDLGVMRWVLTSGQTKRIEIRPKARPASLSCERCSKDFEQYNSQLSILEETNTILKKILTKEPHGRLSAQELKLGWQGRLEWAIQVKS